MKVAELNEMELIELARASETVVGQVFLKLARAEADDHLRAVEKNPRIGPVDAMEDIRYRLGARKGLSRVLVWQSEAVEALKKQSKREESSQ